MTRTVRENADTVATWRFVAVHLMETLARRVPTTPELEAKALLGRHIWDLAQICDQLGRRTAELRLALHENRAPVPAYRRPLEALERIAITGDRLAAVYDGILPDLGARFEVYLAAADPLLDEPTVRLLERAQGEFRRMLAQRQGLLLERPDLAVHDAVALDRLRAALGAVTDFVDYRAEPAGKA